MRRQFGSLGILDFDVKVKDDPIVPKISTQCKPELATRTARRRDEIVRGAAAVLRRRRGKTFRMEEVAEHIGLVKGNIYYYFKDRQDLIFHCHVRCVQTSLDALAEIKKEVANPRKQLRQLLVRHIEVIVGSEYGGALLADIDEMKPAQRRRYVAMRDKFEHAVRDLIQEGIAKGEFRRTNVSLASLAILGSVNWMPKWYDSRKALAPKEVAEWFSDFFVEALTA
jgi:AcrR family transcriptional regulator